MEINVFTERKMIRDREYTDDQEIALGRREMEKDFGGWDNLKLAIEEGEVKIQQYKGPVIFLVLQGFRVCAFIRGWGL